MNKNNSFLKMSTNPKYGTVVQHRGRTMIFGKGADGLRRAFKYIEVEMFLAKVEGISTSTRIPLCYPVRSLVPSVITKTVKITVLNEEVV